MPSAAAAAPAIVVKYGTCRSSAVRRIENESIDAAAKLALKATGRSKFVASEGAFHGRTLFATGYQDGDVAVGLFASDDGITWEKRSTIIASYNDVPSETELQFFGHNHDTAVALVRLDNQDILADGQTAICTSHDPGDVPLRVERA